MARKFKDSKPYPFKINLFDSETYEEAYKKRKQSKMRMIHESDHWRKLRHEDIIMYFTLQIFRLRRQISRPWYCYYIVQGYGAPGRGEFLCWQTAMRAKTIQREEAVAFRKYYSLCIVKSQEILLWLIKLPAIEYTQALHYYLLRFIIIPYPPEHQVNAFRKARETEISRALR
jgi:hypothetical protein